MQKTGPNTIVALILAGIGLLTGTTGAQKPKLPALKDVPPGAFKLVKVQPVKITLGSEKPQKFTQLMQQVIALSRVQKGGKLTLVNTRTLEMKIETNYLTTTKNYTRFQAFLSLKRMLGKWSGRNLELILAPQKKLATELQDLQPALDQLSITPLTVVVSREGKLLNLDGFGKLTERLVKLVPTTLNQGLLTTLLTELLPPIARERVIFLLRPPLDLPADGMLQPGRGFYKWRKQDLELPAPQECRLQYIYLGTGKVGDRRCAVFWCRLALPAVKKYPVKTREGLMHLTQAATEMTGLVRVDLVGGHTLHADLEVAVARYWEQRGEKNHYKVSRTLRLRTYPKVKK